MNNPPAFPLPENAKIDARTHGMTLRDYFAAAAMQAFCSTEYKAKIIEKYSTVSPEQVESAIAKAAYLQADAMLRAREK